MAEIALNDLIQEYGTMISSISRRMLRDEELAKDAAQEVWLRVIKSLPGFQAKSDVFRESEKILPTKNYWEKLLSD